ncbi:MAG: hypothetical protein ABH986_00780 [archaeon]
MNYVPEVTTIQLEKNVVEKLKKSKRYSRQTYSELISNMLKAYNFHRNQYDEFLHKIQQEKMKELWDNDEDEEWEKA